MQQDVNKIWDSASQVLKNTNEIGKVPYMTWFSSIKPLILRDGTIYLIVPSEIHRKQLTTKSTTTAN